MIRPLLLLLPAAKEKKFKCLDYAVQCFKSIINKILYQTTFDKGLCSRVKSELLPVASKLTSLLSRQKKTHTRTFPTIIIERGINPQPAVSQSTFPFIDGAIVRAIIDISFIRILRAGISISTLPTRSAPISAAFVKMPPATRL